MSRSIDSWQHEELKYPVLTLNPDQPPNTSTGAGKADIASSLVPGLGQVLVGRRKLGAWMLGIDLLLLGSFVTLGLWFPSLAHRA
jgi:hypothetical protein